MYITPSVGTSNVEYLKFKGKENKESTNANKGKEFLVGTLMALATLSPLNSPANEINFEEQESRIETVTPPKESTASSAKVKAASERNLSQTPNSNIYFDENKKLYYKWNSKKQKFEKAKGITNVYKTGYLKNKEGEYLTPDGKSFVYRRDSWYLACNLWNQTVDFGVAIAKGYKPTNIADQLNYNGIKSNADLKLFYDSDKNKYYRWADNKQDFVESPITDVTGMYFTKDDTRYKVEIANRKVNVKEVSDEEYQASKQNYARTSKYDGVYRKKNSNNNYYYHWVDSTKTFNIFGDEYDKQQMKVQKADGKIGDFRQGDIGDCWLLAAINGANHLPNPVLREKFKKEFSKSISIDDKENITVTLRGVKKKYTFSKQDIDSVLNTYNYHYAIGDRDVVAIEMAVERYKREIKNSGRWPRYVNNIYNMNRRPYQYDDDYVLDGGHSFDAIHLLTGKEAHYICHAYDNFYFHDDTLAVGKVNENMIKKYLDSNMVLVSYKDKPEDEDGHIVVVTGIDDKNVYVIDSNIDDSNPDKRVHPVARNKEEFMKKLGSIIYTDLSKDITPAKAKPVRVKYIISKEAKQILPPDYKIN